MVKPASCLGRLVGAAGVEPARLSVRMPSRPKTIGSKWASIHKIRFKKNRVNHNLQFPVRFGTIAEK